MKNNPLKILVLIFLININGYSQENDSKSTSDFVTTWDTTKKGISNNTSITIPTFSGVYYYDVDWDNDGVFDQIGISDKVTHDFKKEGKHTIRIRGIFPHFTFNNIGDKLKLVEINQWGIIEWNSMNGMFWGCKNLIGKTNDIPNLSKVVDMDGMFENAIKFNQDIGNWNTSSINNMAGMFSGAVSFNQDISKWNTSNVNNMSFMFNSATAFNQDLDNWDVSNVYSMKAMFQLAINFNGELRHWNTKNTNSMQFMFSQATRFNKYIGDWDTQNVNNMAMMFQGAEDFNQNITSWNTQTVTNMSRMFYRAENFQYKLSNWKLNSLLNNDQMFTDNNLLTLK